VTRFSEIVGHERNIAVLQRILGSTKLAHAYLFAGIEGCGKKKTALALITAAFCGGSEGCGSCPSCRKMAAISHPDLHLVEPDGAFIKIDQVRDLQKELAYRPYEAPRKACIIDGADRLNPAAGNALLKTLEEPPGNALLILLATSIDNVLPTIRSRCQGLLFQGLPEQAIGDYLVHQGVPSATAQVSAALADGSLAKALNLSSADFMAERTTLLTAVSGVTLAKISDLFAVAEKFDKDREAAINSLDLLLSFWRDMLHLRSGADGIINQDLLPHLEREAADRSEQAIMAQIGMITDTRRALQRNANVRLAMDVLLMNLAD
jgi:DNA polymerase III subunit delta'